MTSPIQLRDAVAVLDGQAKGDLRTLWRQMQSAATTGEALHDILPALITAYGSAAATLAAEWYDDLRDKSGAKQRFRAIPVDVKDVGAHSLVGWALTEAKDDAAFRTLVEGGTQRRIANFSRLTVTGSSAADPASAGWKRIGVGACAFCRMLIERGRLYSESTADFASHDHCHCQAYPILRGAEPIDVKEYAKSQRRVDREGIDGPADEITKADQARVRAYIRDHDL